MIGVGWEAWLPCPRLREKVNHIWLVMETKLVFCILYQHRLPNKAAEREELSLNPGTAPYHLYNLRQVIEPL